MITRRSGLPVSLADGTAAAAGSVWGCYLHGLFDNAALRRAWLASLGWKGGAHPGQGPIGLQAALNALADHVEASLNMAQLERIVWGN
jgi:adenosylcobyric acid synthase